MNIPENENTNDRLFCYSLPDGFREWCNEKQIEGRLYEHYDGGGLTGFSVDFNDAESKQLALQSFQGWGGNHFPSDASRDLGPIASNSSLPMNPTFQGGSKD